MTKRVGVVLAFNGPGCPTLRMALVAGCALAVLAITAFASSAEAAPRRMRFYAGNGWYVAPAYISARRMRTAISRRENAEPKQEAKKAPGFGEMPKGPLQIVVSIGTQRVTLFSNGAPVAQSPVSTGTASHPTPLGIFSIIEKDIDHRSNLYGNAPMPFMQRVTWSGVALHQGVLPGYPASHGCIRMPHDFARKLWPITKLGVRVVIARNELTPVQFEHAKLFIPTRKPGESSPVAMNGAGDGLKIRLAEATPQGGSASTDGKAVETISAAEPSDNVIDATGRLKAPSAVPELRKSVEALPAEQMAQPEQVAAGDGSGGAEPAAAAERVKPEASDGPPKPPPRKSAAPVKRTGQVAVFISRKEKKIFVRQGFVPIFDMPVVIDEPDQPLGTHVFTAMAVVDGGVRWNVMTVPNEVAPQAERRDSRKKPKEPPKPTVQLKPSSTAAGALERVQIPKEALDRIGELLIPGSSLVVSDEGLGRETGRATEFIVLTR